jgi:Right handed beta helix region
MDGKPLLHRRAFLQTTSGLVLAAGVARAEEPRRSSNPRATSGDDVEPNWTDRLTVTVGADKGDMVGATDKVIQAAVDYVARLGGGTVQLGPGTFRFRNAVYLASGIRLLGTGGATMLIKEPSITSKLDVDSDWFDQEITLVDDKGFRLGDGVCLRARNPHNGNTTVIKRTLVARSGRRFKLDRPLRENIWQLEDASASTLFPILSGENIHDVFINNLTLDGNRAHNGNLDGNYAGCIFLQDCSRVRVRQVNAVNYNGDGISWQICHDVRVEHCVSEGHAGLGLHPGSGSQRPIIRQNRLRDNEIGVFFCWGVKDGLAEKNIIEGNRSYGLSIGHRDTDNLIRENTIAGSGKAGVLFRPERGKAFAAHRNRLEDNRIVDSGGEQGIGVDVQGETENVTLKHNEIRETRQPLNRIGVRLGPKTKEISLVDNKIEGYATPVDDLRRP